jgi:DNA repair exonuclease SbcCD ATPase subunit
VEWEEVLEALSGRELEDGQSIFLSEWKVTAISGERMGLVAISTGSLGSEEIVWARTALTAAEATLVGDLKPTPRAQAEEAERERVRTTPPPPLPLPPPPSLEGREKLLQRREETLRMMEETTRAAVAEFRKSSEAHVADIRGQLEDLKAQLAAAREQAERDRSALVGLEAERDRLKGMFQPPPAPWKTSPAQPSERELQDVRGEIEQEKMLLQRRAIEFLEREETLRVRESRVEDDSRRVETAREEVDRLRAESESAKDSPAPFDHETARRDIDQRVSALQQKAMDLVAREELIKKRAAEIQALLNDAT